MKATLKLAFILAASAAIHCSALCQNLSWYQQIGGSGNKFIYRLKTDSLNNVYAFGRLRGVVDFDPGPGEDIMNTGTGTNLFLQKRSPDGQHLWVRRIGGDGVDTIGLMSLDDGGNALIVGHFSGTVDFDPGPGTQILTAAGGTANVFLEKLDASGNLLWIKALPYNIGTGSVCTDPQGNILITGGLTGSVDLDPGPGQAIISGTQRSFVLKLNADADFLWVQPIGDSLGGTAQFIDTDSNNNVYICGTAYLDIDFDPSPGVFKLGPVVGSEDLFIAKLDANGQFLWASEAKTTIDYGIFYPIGIRVDAQGNAITSGYFIGNNDFDPGPGTQFLNAHAGTIDIYVWKLNTSGDLVWARQIGSSSTLETTVDLALDDAGNFYATGYIPKTIDMDPGPAQFILGDGYSSQDFFALKLDQSGLFQWAKRMGGPGSDTGWRITVDHQNSVIIAAEFDAPCNVGDKAGENFLTPQSKKDICIVKLSQGPAFCRGVVYRDQNNNQIHDTGEAGIPNVLLSIPQSHLVVATDSSGRYAIFNHIPADTIRPVLPFPYWSATPAFAVTDSTPGVRDFAVNIPAPVRDVAVSAIYFPNFHPGHHVYMDIKVVNYSDTTLNSIPVVMDSFNLSPALQFAWSNLTPVQQTAHQIVWNTGPISPGATALVQVGLLVPDTTLLGTPVDFPISAFLPGDLDESNNHCRLQGTVIAPLDPNDKQVYPTQIAPSQIETTTLQYVIHFQNVGTTPADFIIVRDTLPQNLELNSLQVLGASHPYSWKLRDGRILEARFDHINLPDSTSDPLGSQGYLYFSVRPKKQLTAGETIVNQAGIYFEYNKPVITNVAVSTVTMTSGIAEALQSVDFDFNLQPNPARAHTDIRLDLPADRPVSTVELITLQGLVLQTLKPAIGSTTVRLTGLDHGVYAVLVRSGNAVKGKLLVVE